MLIKPIIIYNFLPVKYGREKAYANIAVYRMDTTVTITVRDTVIHAV